MPDVILGAALAKKECFAMDDKYATLFNDSFFRCMNDESFFDKFYTLFMSASPEIRDKFRNTDFARQERMLEESLNAIVASSEPNQVSDDFLTHVAERHKQLEIDPSHFAIWEDCLLRTAAQCDEKFDESTREAWQAIMRRGIDLMKSRC